MRSASPDDDVEAETHIRLSCSAFPGSRCVARLIVALAFLIVPIAFAGAAETQEHNIIGKWRVTKALDSADISSLDDEEASQLIGRIFTINRKTVKLGSLDDCLPPGFEANLVETTAYVRK